MWLHLGVTHASSTKEIIFHYALNETIDTIVEPKPECYHVMYELLKHDYSSLYIIEIVKVTLTNKALNT
jgi:hypothetical protein